MLELTTQSRDVMRCKPLEKGMRVVCIGTRLEDYLHTCVLPVGWIILVFCIM